MSRLRFLLVHWALIAALVETQQMVEVVRTLVDEVVDTKKILPTLVGLTWCSSETSEEATVPVRMNRREM